MSMSIGAGSAGPPACGVPCEWEREKMGRMSAAGLEKAGAAEGTKRPHREWQPVSSVRKVGRIRGREAQCRARAQVSSPGVAELAESPRAGVHLAPPPCPRPVTPWFETLRRGRRSHIHVR